MSLAVEWGLTWKMWVHNEIFIEISKLWLLTEFNSNQWGDEKNFNWKYMLVLKVKVSIFKKTEKH